MFRIDQREPGSTPRKGRSRIRSLAGGALLAVVSVFSTGGAFAERPLLFEDTKTIFQRVLTKPGQTLYDAKDGKEAGALWPLQPVYVYERDGDWLRIGKSEIQVDGWIKSEGTVPWVHNIVGAFTLRGDERVRQLIYDTQPRLADLLQQESYLDIVTKNRSAAEKKQDLTDSGVVSIEPELAVDVTESFYLMPITDFRERVVGYSQYEALEMEIAAVPLKETAAGSLIPDEPLKTGIVFVIDTTQSMGPFIEESLVTVREIVDQLRESGDEGSVSFGLVGFRDNPEGRPGIEYRVKEYLALDPNAPADAIVTALGEMKALQDVSTWGFPEDSIAGLTHAINETVWETKEVDFAGRIIILITDAPPKPPGDENAGYALSPKDVRTDADDAKVGIATLHIKSKSSRNYDGAAEEAYEAISGFHNVLDQMYYPVDARDPDQFKRNLKGVIGRLVNAISEEPKIEVDDEIGDDEGGLGLAMRLAYLARRSGENVPPILRGWTLDRSFEEFVEVAVEPRVLVTRNQLLTMSEVMTGIVREAEEAAREGQNELFFENVRNVVAGIGADGSRLINEDADTLGGMIGEFLEYMPYMSKRRINTITETEWRNDASLRINTIHDLRSKLDLYEILYRKADIWTALYDGQPEGEHVYALPLDALP